MSVTDRHHTELHLTPGRRVAVRILAAVVACAFALTVVGGYGFGWRWTGLSGDVTLWDWLQVLALPVALAIGPLLWHHRARLTRSHRTGITAGLITFAALVSAGYLVPMPWTGFTGNTLWDWLELTLLPLVVAFASLWAGVRTLRGAHIVGGAVLAVMFVGLVICGYLVPWSWTGFTGNTMWDWIKLLLLPVLVPIVLVPALTSQLADRFEPGRRADG